MLALGADGNVWFTEPQVDKVGKITPQGAISELQVPEAGVPLGIASGADKNLWVTMRFGTAYSSSAEGLQPRRRDGTVGRRLRARGEPRPGRSFVLVKRH
jgi:hypothetical protein